VKPSCRFYPRVWHGISIVSFLHPLSPTLGSFIILYCIAVLSYSSQGGPTTSVPRGSPPPLPPPPPAQPIHDFFSLSFLSRHKNRKESCTCFHLISLSFLSQTTHKLYMISLASVFFPDIDRKESCTCFHLISLAILSHTTHIVHDFFNLSFLSRLKIERNLAPASISSHCHFVSI